VPDHTRHIHIGCSGWQYRHWRGTFYPADMPAATWFAYYAARFDSVEANNTFYRLPAAETVSAWKAQAPDGFVYALKASRFLTHMKKLVDPDDPVHLFMSRAALLGRRLGPILYQLPPRFDLNLPRLERFLEALPTRSRFVIELRDPRWYDDRVYQLLTRHRIALCIHDMAGSSSGRLEVGPFVYLRLHGPTRYSGSYSDNALASWAHWCVERVAEGKGVYVYFNNDIGGDAPHDAQRLRQFIDALP
jgi:uncharacterized protein YecE (DUF72 family)